MSAEPGTFGDARMNTNKKYSGNAGGLVMACRCGLPVHDENMQNVVSEGGVLAKSQMCCHECGGNIPEGAIYFEEISEWAGAKRLHITCLDCLSIRDAFPCKYKWQNVLNQTWDWIIDHRGNIPKSFFSDLTDKAKETIQEMVDDFDRECFEHELEIKYDKCAQVCATGW
jgi:hypothetical protein